MRTTPARFSCLFLIVGIFDEKVFILNSGRENLMKNDGFFDLNGLRILNNFGSRLIILLYSDILGNLRVCLVWLSLWGIENDIFVTNEGIAKSFRTE